MSLLDATVNWFHNMSTEGFIIALIGLALIVFIIFLFAISLKKLLDSNKKMGYYISKVKSWPPDNVVSFFFNFAMILLIICIPYAILISESGSEFLILFVLIMVAIGILAVRNEILDLKKIKGEKQ